jgi:transposase
VLEALAQDLKERGDLDLSECFIDGTFVVAKKRDSERERPSGAKVRSLWRWQTAMVFLSPSHTVSASPHEVLVQATLAGGLTAERPERLIGDKAYDSDPLDAELKEQGIEMIAPHKSNRKKASTQDGRPLRRYKRRWKIERLFAWLQNFRRIAMRFDFHDENYLGFVHLGCIRILLRCYL